VDYLLISISEYDILHGKGAHNLPFGGIEVLHLVLMIHGLFLLAESTITGPNAAISQARDLDPVKGPRHANSCILSIGKETCCAVLDFDLAMKGG